MFIFFFLFEENINFLSMTKTLNVLGEFEIFSDPNALLHERFSFEIGLHPSDYFRDLGILTQRAPSP